MIIDSLVKGGRERRLLELLKDFKQRKNIELALVLFSKKVEYDLVYKLDIPIYFLERKPKKDPRVFLRFFQLCKKERPDLIHSWGTMPTIYAIPTAKLLNIKLLNATVADAPLDLNWKDSRYFRAKLTYPFSDFIVGNSNAGLQAYNAPSQKSRCIYNGFDFNRIAEVKSHNELKRIHRINTSKVVGMVGAFFDRKDFMTFVKSAELVLEKRPDTTFLAVGGGPNLEKCKSLVKTKYEDRILFTGQINDVESLINIFDVGVLATNARVHGEGISNAILEYMVLGKPVVATTGGGTNEIVIPKETGFLVEDENPEDMANRIMYLIDFPNEAFRMGVNGKLKIHKEFTLDRMAKKYLELYCQLLNISSESALQKIQSSVHSNTKVGHFPNSSLSNKK